MRRFTSAAGHSADSASTPVRKWMGGGRPRHYRKVLGVICWGKMCVVPEVVIDKIQTYPTPKNVKEVQAFLGILWLRGFLFPNWYNAFIPYAMS